MRDAPHGQWLIAQACSAAQAIARRLLGRLRCNHRARRGYSTRRTAMRLNALALLLAICATCSTAASAATAVPAGFDWLRFAGDYQRAMAAEEAGTWKQVPWRRDAADAADEARRTGKPLFVFV